MIYTITEDHINLLINVGEHGIDLYLTEVRFYKKIEERSLGVANRWNYPPVTSQHSPLPVATAAWDTKSQGAKWRKDDSETLL